MLVRNMTNPERDSLEWEELPQLSVNLCMTGIFTFRRDRKLLPDYFLNDREILEDMFE